MGAEETYGNIANRDDQVNTNSIVDFGIVSTKVRGIESGLGITVGKASQVNLSAKTNSYLVREAIKSYKKKSSELDSLNFKLSIAEDIAHNTIDTLHSYIKATGPIGAILFGGAAAGAKAYVSDQRESLIGDLTETNQNLLGAGFSDYLRDNDNLNEFPFEDVNLMEEALGLDRVRDITNSLPNLDAAGKSQAIGPLIDALANMNIEEALRVRNGFEAIAGEFDDFDLELSNLFEKSVHMGASLAIHTKLTQQGLDKLTLSVDAINLSLDGTIKGIGQNSQSLSDLAFIFYDGATPQKKLNLLQKKLVKIDDIERVRVTLEKEIRHKEAIKEVTELVANGGHLVTILKNIGGLDDEADTLGSVVNFAGVALSAYMSFQTGGNPIAGVAAISGLFGAQSSNGGPDPIMMAEFEKIHQKLEEIVQKVDLLLEGQVQMISKLNRIEQSLVSNLKKNHFDFLEVKKLLLDNSLQDFKFWGEIHARTDNFEALHGQYLSFDEIYSGIRGQGIYSGKWDIFDTLTSHNQLSNIEASLLVFGQAQPLNERIDDMLASANLSDDEEKEKSEFEETRDQLDNISTSYTRLLAVEKQFRTVEEYGTNCILESCLACSDSIKVIDKKYSMLEAISADQTEFILNYPSAMKMLIHAGRVQELAELILNFHYVRALYSPNGNEMMTKEQTLTEGVNTSGLRWLEGVDNLCELSIAQHTLMSGDVLLPLTYKFLGGQISNNSEGNIQELRTNIYKLIKDQHLKVFSENLLLYFVHRRILDHNGFHQNTHIEYESAIQNPAFDFSALHQLLGTNNISDDFSGPLWNFQSTDSGQTMLVVDNDFKLVMPHYSLISPDSVYQLNIPPHASRLHSIRKLISEHMRTYNFHKSEVVTPDLYRNLLLS